MLARGCAKPESSPPPRFLPSRIIPTGSPRTTARAALRREGPVRLRRARVTVAHPETNIVSIDLPAQAAEVAIAKAKENGLLLATISRRAFVRCFTST